MSKKRSLTRFVVLSALGFIVLASLVPGGFAWPSVQDHSASDTGSFYTGEPAMAMDKINGRLRGHGLFDESLEKGPWGDPATSVAWGCVDTFLPAGDATARWDYGDATYEVAPEYFVKQAAIDTTVTLKDEAGSLVNLKAGASHTIDTPFETWRGASGGSQDEYRDTRFVVEPGSVSFISTEMPVSNAVPSGEGAGTTGLDYQVMTEKDGEVYLLMAFGYDAGLGTSCSANLDSTFSLPFNDDQYGTYNVNVILWVLKGSMGPSVSWGSGAAGNVEYSYLRISVGNNYGTRHWFYDASSGASLSYAAEEVIGGNTYGKIVFPFSWAISPGLDVRYAGAGAMHVYIESAIHAHRDFFGACVVSCYIPIDSFKVQMTYSDTIGGNPPTTATFPLNVKLSTGDTPSKTQKTGVWDFAGPFGVTDAWTIERCIDFIPQWITVAEFRMQSVTAQYRAFKPDPNRILGMDLILNEDAGRRIVMGGPGGGGIYTTTIPDLASYFIYNDPTAPARTARLRLRVDIVGDIVGGKGEYQDAVYLFDDIIFRFRATYSELFAPVSIPFSGVTASITLGFPDMTWMSGDFDRLLTSDSAYVLRLDALGVQHYPMLDPAPAFKGFAGPDDPNPDLPLWDMSFHLYVPWIAKETNLGFTLTITMDDTVPSAVPTWPVPDVGSNGILNVGSEVFEVAYADLGLPDAQSPIVAAILWWEYTVDEVLHRDYLEMTGPDGVLKAGVASGIISPELFTVGVTYSFFMEIIDGGGNFVVTPAREYIIIQETAPPIIRDITIGSWPVAADDTLVYGPAAGIPSFHASVMDANLDPVSVKVIVAGSEFQMTDLGGGYFGLMSSPGGVAWDAWVTCWSGLSSGEYSAFLYAADTYPHSTWIPFTIVKDHETPTCSILGPFEDGDYVSGAPVVLLHILDSVSWVEKVWYSFAPSPTQSDGSWRAAEFDAHLTLPGGEDILIAIRESDWLLVPQGPFRLSFTIGDTGGNNATIQFINLIKDSIAPNLILDRPAAGSMWDGTAPTFRFLIADSELYLAQVGYQVGPCDARYIDIASGVLSAVDHAWVFNGTLNQEDWGSLDNETDITISFFAIDSASNEDIETRTITVDKVGPRIRIIAPVPASTAGGFAVSYLLEVDEPHLQGLWYSFDNGVTLVPITELSAVFDQEKWDAAAGTREMKILFIGRDTLGNWGYAEVTVIRSDYSEGGLPWQVGICMAGAAGVLFSINAWNKKRAGGR